MNDIRTLPSTSWLRHNRPVLYVVGAACALSLLGLVYALFFKESVAPVANISAVTAINANDATRPPARPASTPRSYSVPPTAASNTGAGAYGSPESEIRRVLDGWAASARAHDLDTQMTFYADTLDVYYRRRGVIGKDTVRQDRERAFQKFSSIDVIISDLTVAIDRTGETATATFDKTWTFSGEKNFNGSVRQMLWLTRVGGYWLITGEKDLKVYYVSSG